MKGISKVILIILSLLIVLAVVFSACAKPAPPPAPAPAPAPPVPKLPEKLHWDVSVWGGPRVLTHPIADWAKDMNELTDGRWEVEMHYGAVLAPSKEQLDGLKAGLFDVALSASHYAPGKHPLLTVDHLPFITPPTIKQKGEWGDAIARHPAIQKELEQWNAKFLFHAPLSSYEFMGKVPIRTVDDLDGVRMRIDPLAGKVLEAFGLVPTMVSPSEMYVALDRGMLDSICLPWTYTFGSYKLYELSKYATIDIDLKGAGMNVVVAKDSWDALPDEWKKLAEFSARKAWDRYDKYNMEADMKWLPVFSEAGVEIIHFPPEERAKVLAKAEAAWEDWVKDMEAKGLPGREILEFTLAKRDEIIAKAEK